MPSERIQRRIDRLLDQAEEAGDARDWTEVRHLAREAWFLDESNEDALALFKSAEQMLGGERVRSSPSPSAESDAQPVRAETRSARLLRAVLSSEVGDTADRRQAAEAVIRFREEREWGQLHAPREVASALSIEASELLAEFLWRGVEDADVLFQDHELRRRWPMQRSAH